MLQLFSPSFSRPCASGHRVVACLVLAILATFAINPQLANAQKGAIVTTVSGTLVSVKKKGRTATLTVKTTDGETKEFQIAARTKLIVTAKGDNGFLKKGQFVSTQAVESNNMLFAKKFTVQVGAGRKAGVFAKPPKAPGVSKSAWNVAGQITGRANDKNYPEYEVITVRTGKKTQFNLGMMYYAGTGTEQSNEQAVAWFRKAAEQGLGQAQQNLGTFYANGWGVQQNEEEAAFDERGIGILRDVKLRPVVALLRRTWGALRFVKTARRG